MRQLLLNNEKALIRYVKQLVRNVDTAQDIVQEGFLRLWKQAPGDINGHEVEWLFRVCRNLAIDVLRKEVRVSAKKQDLQDFLQKDIEFTEDVLIEADRAELVAAVFEKLKENQKEVLRLKFQEGMSYHQISRITGHSVSHIGVLIHNTIKKLKILVAKERQMRGEVL